MQFITNRRVSMSRILSLSVVGLVALSLVACAGVGGYQQPAGLFPYGAIFTESTSGTIILDNGATPTKEGRACGSYIIVVGTGDTTVETAMKNGGITKAVFISHYIKSIVGPIYGEVCTIVRGN